MILCLIIKQTINIKSHILVKKDLLIINKKIILSKIQFITKKIKNLRNLMIIYINLNLTTLYCLLISGWDLSIFFVKENNLINFIYYHFKILNFFDWILKKIILIKIVSINLIDIYHKCWSFETDLNKNILFYNV